MRKWIKTFEDASSKRTKIVFYWTHTQYGTFYKTIFEWVVDRTFDRVSQVRDFIDDKTDYIYDKFAFDLVFDHVVMHYVETDEAPSDVKIIKEYEGELVFPSETGEVKKEEPKGEIKKGEIKKEEPKKPKKEYESCWIEPNGEAHRVGFTEHNNWAHHWLKQHYPDRKSTYDYDYEVLQDMGWIRILGWTDPPAFYFPKNPTPRQIKAVKDYCQRNYCDLPKEIDNI